MKTTEHGIEDSKDVEKMYLMRLMALLQELVREKGYKGAARVLEIDQRTVAESARTGRLSRRVRDALERALQEGIGSAAARQRERNDQQEERLAAVEGGLDEVGREMRRRLAAIEGEMGGLRHAQHPESEEAVTGQASEGEEAAEAGTVGEEAAEAEAGTRPTPESRARREFPDLVTREPAEDDEENFGEAWPLIVEWRELKDAHPNDGGGLDWLRTEERLLRVELTLLEGYGLTLPPARFPLRGFDRDGQTSWRRTALYDTRRARRWRELLRRVVTLGLWQ